MANVAPTVAIQIRRVLFRLICIFMRPVLPLSLLLVGHIHVWALSVFEVFVCRIKIWSSWLRGRTNRVLFCVSSPQVNDCTWENSSRKDKLRNYLSFRNSVHSNEKRKTIIKWHSLNGIEFLRKQCHRLCIEIFSRNFQLKQWNDFNDESNGTGAVTALRGFLSREIVIAIIRGHLVCSECSRLCVLCGWSGWWRFAQLNIYHLIYSNNMRNACGIRMGRVAAYQQKESMSNASIRKIYCDSVECKIVCPSLRTQRSPNKNCMQSNVEPNAQNVIAYSTYCISTAKRNVGHLWYRHFHNAPINRWWHSTRRRAIDSISRQKKWVMEWRKRIRRSDALEDTLAYFIECNYVGMTK